MCKKYDLTRIENSQYIKNLMKMHAISETEVAKRSGYSINTVNNMMNNNVETRSETYMIIRRTVLNMVEESPLDGNPYPNKLMDGVKIYLKKNKINSADFSKMCSISPGWFTPAYVKCRPNISLETVARILKNTGWTSEQFRSGNFETINKEGTGMWSRDFKPEGKIAEEVKEKFEEAVEQLNLTDEMKNKVYSYNGSEYFLEYDIVTVQHIKKPITREEFLKEVTQ